MVFGLKVLKATTRRSLRKTNPGPSKEICEMEGTLAYKDAPNTYIIERLKNQTQNKQFPQTEN